MQRHKQAEEMANYRAGIIAAAAYNNNPNRKKGAPVIKPLQFFGATDTERQEVREESPEQLMSVMKAWGMEVKRELQARKEARGT